MKRTRTSDDFDILVVGAGHAGCEAAFAASVLGLKTGLVTIHFESIAQMSCNPAIGGLAKGHLVREIDALGGLMGWMADRTGIQFRLLNRSRGPAVQAPRSQNDKALYRQGMKTFLEKRPSLSLYQGMAAEVLAEGGRAAGVRMIDGRRIGARAVVVTPGTFLNGLIHIGLRHYPAGRANEPASYELAESLRTLGLRSFRLKTGTPMRLDRTTIDWSRFEAQPGDDRPVPFSYRTRDPLCNRVLCHIGQTNERTHRLIRRNLSQSPLYGGAIKGVGARYCPSIEDKVVKFPQHPRHHFFLEPEGLDTVEIYVNGLSTSLPYDIQQAILRTIPGLDEARILRPAYAIEYDAFAPTDLQPTLESRILPGLFLAGQVNGTSGYEEAAAQGLVAGLNAALKLRKKKPFLPGREESYIGVLIDDLVTKGVEEPYRLFTSRSEHRLHLRIDNADERLMPLGRKLGLLPEDVYQEFERKREKLGRVFAFLGSNRVADGKGGKTSLRELLKKPEKGWPDVLQYGRFPESLTDEEIRRVEAEVKYEGYLTKQAHEIARLRRIDRLKIPAGLDLKAVHGLTREAVEKMERRRPLTMGELKKIPGLTPSDVWNVYIHLQASRKKAGPRGRVPRGTSADHE